MIAWQPSRMWEGEDAYVVGGGTSLTDFDWAAIAGKNTIGINSAYRLGSHVLRILLWGDYAWWERIGRKGTETFGGLVVGCADRLEQGRPDPCPWLLVMRRATSRRLSHDKLLFCGNTGSMGINLALILGARRVFLLGFDMKLNAEGTRANWHDDPRYGPPKAEVYRRFMNEMRAIPASLKEAFPGTEIVNVNDDSELKLFPTVTLREHFGKDVILCRR